MAHCEARLVYAVRMIRQALLVTSLALMLPLAPHAQTPAKKAPPAAAKTTAKDLPPMKTRPTAKAVVDEHMDAINHCDWTRLMAQYPNDVEFFLPGGQVVKGREAVGDLFRDFVKPVKDGGLC